MRECAPKSTVLVGDNRSCPVKGVGNIPFVTSSREEKVIYGVLYVPNFARILCLLARWINTG